ncbi:MAG: GNAT family N-acetyltransferase [Phycisphaerales bacterium]|nr:GNAT family N-acetyltransferase [Phycisphaerales bacterium]
MSTIPKPPGATPARSYEIVRFHGELLQPAAARLIASAAKSADTAGAFLETAGAMGIDLGGFWGSVEHRKGGTIVREVALAIPGSGGALMVFTSEPRGSASEAELAEVVARACSEAPKRCTMAQALLLPRERAVERALGLSGFGLIADLAYLRRPIGLAPEHGLERSGGLPAGVRARLVADLPGGYRQSRARLTTALERSYEGTLDCPELCAMRTASEALESHRAAGAFDPALWWLIEHQGAPAGVLLFSPSVDGEAVELVYVGVAPELRGLGLGRTLLRMGLEAVCDTEAQWVTCAVDLRNAPARKLYAQAGFRRFGLRRAFVRSLA